jgi:hypothetical protein
VACLTRDKSKYKKPVSKCAYSECEFKRSEENEYCGKQMEGNDGYMYMSKPNKNNICSWKKVNESIISLQERNI